MGDLISYQNGRKGWLVIPDEIEQTVIEYASRRIYTCRQRPLFGMWVSNFAE
jgi:hypothetical protein